MTPKVPTGDPEVIAAEKASNEEKLFEALNDPQFVAFLGKYPAEANLVKDVDKNPEKILEKKELFDKGTIAIDKLNGFITTEFSERLGVKIPEKAINGIREHVTDQLVENPDYVFDIIKTFEEAETLSADIAGLEQQVKDLGGIEQHMATIGQLEQKKDTFEKASSMNIIKAPLSLFWIGGGDIIGAFRAGKQAFKEYKDSRAALKAQYGYDVGFFDKAPIVPSFGIKDEIKNIEASIAKIQEKLASVDELNSLKADKDTSLKKVNEKLLGTLMSEEAIKNVALAAVTKKMEALAKGYDLPAVDEASNFLEKLEQFEEDTKSDIGADQKAFADKISAMVEVAVTNQLEAVIDTTTVGSKPLDEMVAGLSELINREKLGATKGGNVKWFVLATLDEIQATMPDSPETNTKKILIAAARRKLSKITK